MQEEVEQRIVSLMISCGKLGEQEFRKAVAKLLEQLKNGHQKHQYSKANPHGKMTVKQLAAKDKGLQSIEVTDQNIGSFNRIARKYGIDFAPFKVKGEKRYMVFFKAPDADAMTAEVDGAEVPVTTREFNILYKLLSYPNHTFSRSQLMDEFWGLESDTSLRAVDVYITKLRDKCSICGGFEITIVRGLGYKAVLK